METDVWPPGRFGIHVPPSHAEILTEVAPSLPPGRPDEAMAVGQKGRRVTAGAQWEGQAEGRARHRISAPRRLLHSPDASMLQ